MSGKIFKVIKSGYHTAPGWMRWIFLPIYGPYRLYNIFKPFLWIIEGNEKDSGRDLAFAFTGQEENRNYVCHTFFKDDSRFYALGRTWLWRIEKKARHCGHPVAVVIYEVPRILRYVFKSKHYCIIPCWIAGIFDMAGDNRSLLKNSQIRSDVRRTRKNNLMYEVTRSADALCEFYNTMYLPYIEKIYGNEAMMWDLPFVKKLFQRCELLMVKKDGLAIAGTLIDFKDKIPYLRILGVRDANIEYVTMGCIGALYYFAILYVKSLGYDKISAGGTRAFLRNGLLRFKMKWGFKVSGLYESVFLMNTVEMNDAVRDFLIHNPFICIKGKKYFAAVFTRGDGFDEMDEIKKFYKKEYICGLEHVFLYYFSERGSVPSVRIPDEWKEYLSIESAENLFSKKIKIL